jgi:hypothetical protein
VKGIATRTNGRFDFSFAGVDLRSKVIPQLAAAQSPTHDNVSVQVSGAGSQSIVQSQIQSLIPGNLSTILVDCEQVEDDWSVLTTGTMLQRNVEYLSERRWWCSDEFMISVVSKIADMLRLTDLEHQVTKRLTAELRESVIAQAVAISVRSGILSPWTSFVGVVTQEAPPRADRRVFVWGGSERGYLCVELDRHREDAREQILNAISSEFRIPLDSVDIDFEGRSLSDFSDCQLVTLTPPRLGLIRLNVRDLCGHTFQFEIDLSSTVQDLRLMVADRTGEAPEKLDFSYGGRVLCTNEAPLIYYHISSDDTVHIHCRLAGGGAPLTPELSEIERPLKENDVSIFLEGHSAEGCWLNAEEMMELSGLAAPPQLPSTPRGLSEKVLATVLALAILRKRYEDERDLWQLLELKGLIWLGKACSGIEVNWSAIIDSIAATLP